MRSVEVGRGYLIDLFTSVNRRVFRKLLSMGLPFAGLDFYPENKGLYIDDVFFIDKYGRTFVNSKHINDDDFRKILFLATHHGKDFALEFYRKYDFKMYRIRGNSIISYGRVSCEVGSVEEFEKEHYLFEIPITACIPRKNLPKKHLLPFHTRDRHSLLLL